MRLLTEYEIVKILNRAEIDYAQKMKKSTGDTRSFNIHGIYTVREIRNKVNKYLDAKYEK